jgi:putative membrane protein
VAKVASEQDFVPDRRLHPLSWLFVLLSSMRQFIVPLIAVVLFGVRDDGSAWGALFVIPFVLASIWRQHMYRYGFGPRGLVIQDGLLFRNVRQIEYERIENVDTQRGVLHRLLNVAEVRLESSRGGKPEALIRVLGVDAVQELRDRIFSGAHQGAPEVTEAPREQVLLRLSPAELMRYGFVDNRGTLVVAAAVGVLSQTGAMGGFGMWMKDAFPNAVGAVGFALALVIVGVVLSIFFLLRLLSLAWAVVALHDFTLTRAGNDLRIRYGLLTNVALTLRLPRIQAVHRTETVLHRFFGRVSLHVDLAGDGGQPVDQNSAPQTRMRMLAPICTPSRSAELIRVALPMLERDEAPAWQPLAPGARGRIFRKFVSIATLVCAIPAIAWFGYGALLFWFAIVPVGWLHATQYVRHTRWALTREAVLFQRGWLHRRLSIVPRTRVQVVQQIASPFDRRHGMATIVIDTAGASPMRGVVRIPYMRATDVRGVARAIYVSSEMPYRMAYAESGNG